MKRALGDLFFIVAACCVALAAFSVFIIFFGIPNTIGLNRGPVMNFLQPAVDFVMNNQQPVLWAAGLLLLAIPLGMSLFMRRTAP